MKPDSTEPRIPGGMSRRKALKQITGMAATGLAAASCGTAARAAAIDRFLRRHFHELSREELDRILRDLEHTYSQRYGKDVTVTATPAAPDTRFGYALDISRCIGCRRCVYACVEENNQSRDPQIHWITVLEMDQDEGVDLQHATPYYDPEAVPQEGKFYFPVACQQCAQPPCVKVCPVKATWREPDGIVVIDQDWCIGCRCCMSACPYGARHFNWTEPGLPAANVEPNMSYLGNRPRSRGVVEKCHFCLQRVREPSGRYPRCVEVCPVGARKFGNLLDPDSEVSYILRNKRVFILKKELNTQPQFFYYYGL